MRNRTRNRINRRVLQDLFLPDPVSLIAHYDFLEGVDDQILNNLVDGGTDFFLGADGDPSADDPTWVTGRPTVGLDFDGGDHCEIVTGQIRATGDFVFGFCVHFDTISSDRLWSDSGGNHQFLISTTTTINFRIGGVSKNITVSAISLTKYVRVFGRRVSDVIDIQLNGTLSSEETGIYTGIVDMQLIGATGGPTGQINGRIADGIVYSERTFTDIQLAALDPEMKNRVKAKHGLQDGDFA